MGSIPNASNFFVVVRMHYYSVYPDSSHLDLSICEESVASCKQPCWSKVIDCQSWCKFFEIVLLVASVFASAKDYRIFGLSFVAPNSYAECTVHNTHSHHITSPERTNISIDTTTYYTRYIQPSCHPSYHHHRRHHHHPPQPQPLPQRNIRITITIIPPFDHHPARKRRVFLQRLPQQQPWIIWMFWSIS